MQKARWPNSLIKKFGHLDKTKDLDLFEKIRIPLINADRLTLSLLPRITGHLLGKAFSAMHIKIARLLHLFQ